MQIDLDLTPNPAQQFIIDAKMLESGFSCVLQLPTGAGKTWLARRAIQIVLHNGLRAVYLTPLKALADELYPLWQVEFEPYQVGIFTGDYSRNGKNFPVPFSSAQVLIMTPERLDACTRAWRSHWHWIPEVDLIVVDEVHLLGEGHRGPRLEGAITRFRRLNPFCRFLCLSATLGNREELADWLNGIEYESTWRPVPLTWRIARYRKADEKPSMLAKEIAHARDAGGRSLVFVQSRRRCESLSGFLEAQGIRSGFHHAGLTHKNRREVEIALRSSEVDALISTGTLEMGLNMPVRQVVLYDTQAFDGSQFAPLPVNTVWQRAGRAGRPGLDNAGEAVLFAPTWDRSADHYSSGKFERIESTLGHPAALSEQIIAEVGSGLCRSELQLERVLSRSLAAFQGKNLPVQQTLEDMINAEMIRPIIPDEGIDSGRTHLVATPLGRITTRHLLQPATVLMIRNLLERLPGFTRFDALFAIALTPDYEPVIPVDFEELPVLSMQLSGIPSFAVSQLRDARTWFHHPTGKRMLSALKTAAMILNWCNQADEETEDLAHEFGVYPFELHRLRDSFDRLLLAAAAVSHYIFTNHSDKEADAQPEKHESTQRLEHLRNMVVGILPAAAATLCLIDGIGPKWARKLHDHGVNDLQAFAIAKPEDLSGIQGLSDKRIKQWIEDAKTKAIVPIPLTESSAPLIECDLPPIETETHDPYRMRRAMELTVTPCAAGEHIVSGGLEPHKVCLIKSTWECDCMDYAKGNLCKHILAVRRHQGRLKFEKKTEHNHQESGCIDLLSLWFEP